MDYNLFAATVPYQLLQSCILCKERCILVTTKELLNSPIINKLVSAYFGKSVFVVKPFGYYKNHPFELLSFRLHMRKLKEDIEKEYTINNIYFFSDVDPVTQWISKNMQHTGETIIVEEGIGLYRNTNFQHEVIFDYMGKLLFGRTFEKVCRMGESDAVTSIICSMPQLLSKKQNEKKIYMQNPCDFSQVQNKMGIKPFKDADWFIGQSLVEDGVTDLRKYLHIIDLLKEISAIQGRKLIVKPHPREDSSKYRGDYCVFSEKDTPIELLIDSETECNVYSIFSSALLTLSTMKNVKAFALYKLLMDKSLIETLDSIFFDHHVIIVNDLNYFQL